MVEDRFVQTGDVEQLLPGEARICKDQKNEKQSQGHGVGGANGIVDRQRIMLGVPMSSNQYNRRGFLHGSALTAGAWILTPHASFAAEIPSDDPSAALGLAWTGNLKWNQVIDISSIDGEGKYWDGRLVAAQKLLSEKGGGIVYFPAGEYHFEDFIRLGDNIVLRGARPAGKMSAQDNSYALPSKLVFPEYVPLFRGDGSPIDTAFKGIVLDDPEKASNCGVVELALERGHIHLAEGKDHTYGRNRIVFGCALTNAAVADPKLLRSKKSPSLHGIGSPHVTTQLWT